MEKERVRNVTVQEIHRPVAFITPPTDDLAQNPRMCPDRELNQQHFGSQATAQYTETHQPGQVSEFLSYSWNIMTVIIKQFPMITSKT